VVVAVSMGVSAEEAFEAVGLAASAAVDLVDYKGDLGTGCYVVKSLRNLLTDPCQFDILQSVLGS
jgi:hypothetical protein